LKEYDPLEGPDPREWLAMDEGERIQLVLDYHRRAGIEVPNEVLHAVFHAVVENQAALGEETPVREALERLMGEGLDRHEAIHAVGCVLAEHMWGVMGGEVSEEGDLRAAYFEDVRRLTVGRWLERYGGGEG